MWFLYVLSCNDGSLYTGISTDVAKRLKIHLSGKGAKYTRSRLPVSLLESVSVGNKSAALKVEFSFKKLSRHQKLAYLDAGLLSFLQDRSHCMQKNNG